MLFRSTGQPLPTSDPAGIHSRSSLREYGRGRMTTSRHRRLETPTGPFYVRLVEDGPIETGWYAMIEDSGPASRRLETLGPEDTELLPELCERILAAMSGLPVDFDDIELPAGTPFQRAIWRETRRIGRGETRTYGALAVAVGRPGAARAVGQAMRRNPQPIITPCHRVVGSTGLGGFGGHGPSGSWPTIKARLLANESAHRKA